jgi:transcriptional regulator with GAF, ATPase, and Fis domain
MKSNQSPAIRVAKASKAAAYPQISVSFLTTLDVILTSIHEPVVVLDADLKVVRTNRSFYRTFDLNGDDAKGRNIYALGDGKWDIPRLKELLENIRSEQSDSDDFELEHNFGSQSSPDYRILHINARWIGRDDNQTRLIFLAITDATDREYYRRGLEHLVEKRLADLIEAREEAENRKEIAEKALLEITKLKGKLEQERAYLQDEIQLKYNRGDILGQSDAIKQVLHKIEQISRSNTTVLILGETGTGKELVARALHRSSLRKNRALIKVNCATLMENLIESELFGHEKGAFTGSQSKHLGRFEIAHGSTLFLDEIGELPLGLQAKLLRVIQDGEFERLGSSHTIKVDTRILAATNRNLEEEVRDGRFREDLWYRLNVFPITVPPLRDRPDDIPLLVDFFVKKIAKQTGKTISIVPTGVMNSLLDYHWPGNIRELQNVLERAVINSPGAKLRLLDELTEPIPSCDDNRKSLQTVEKEHILLVLEQSNWKISGKDSAAEILGLDRSTLRARMRKLNITK